MWKTDAMLILASQSSTRKALLTGAGLRFEMCPAEIDEREVEAATLGKTGSASEVARRLAEAKAAAVALSRPGAVVVGADQVLEFEGELLHKPQDLHGARQQLDRLRGGTHALHAGVAIAVGTDLLWSTVDTARLTMRAFSDAERDAILAMEGDAVLGTVGSYRLEGPSVQLFERLEGDYFSILGLPLLPLLVALRQHAPQTLEG